MEALTSASLARSDTAAAHAPGTDAHFVEPTLLPVEGGEQQDEEQGVAKDDVEDDCGPSFFEEEAECRDLLARVATMLPADRTTLLPPIGHAPDGAAALLEVKFAGILERYQENAYLLHPYLGDLMQPLVALLLRYLPSAEEWWSQPETATTMTARDEEGDTEEEDRRFVVEANALGQNFDMFDADAPKNALHLVCRAIYFIVKTAREKSCTSYFPNDTKHYEDVFYALQHWKSDPACQREWEVRYCLLLWLSNLVLVPFNLNLIDTHLSQADADSSRTATTASSSTSLSDALLVTAVGFLADTSKCRDGAALLTARLLTRPDSRRHRDHFFRYANHILSNPNRDEVRPTCLGTRTDGAAAATSSPPETLVAKLEAATADCHAAFLFPGILLSVAKTLKLGKREELVVYTSSGLLGHVAALFRARTSDALLCKAAIKVTQRLVLTMLRKTSANWRYQRHVVSLSANLTTVRPEVDGHAAPVTSVAEGKAAEDDEDVIEGDEEALEEGIGALLEAIAHKDTIVRWSAAKGIGRVCARLPVAMAEEVIEALIGDAFSSAYNDSQWHGGLLALAELCRRSMMSAEQLPQVVQIIARGLAFDLSKGTYSVGSHVRDAACYVCWSIARAYDAQDLEAHVHGLSASLVITALFDREVNVRRAAAAAFQECVGRLGNFPDGIDLVTTMDFFSLASLKNAYEVVAPRVAVYAAYRSRMLKAIVDVKFLHWDRRVREEAAVVLGAMAPLEDASTLKAMVLPTLLARVVDNTVAARHSAILGLAALVANLPAASWTVEERQALAEVLPRVDAARLFRSRGGEFIRDAMCRLLRAFAEVNFSLPEAVTVTKVSGATAKAKTLGRCQEFLEETWKNLLEWLQLSAADTFCAFANTYYTSFQAPFHDKVMAKMLAGCTADKSPMERRGFLLAMGGLPVSLLCAPVPQAEGTEEAAKEIDSGSSSSGNHLIYADVVRDALCRGCLLDADEDPKLADAEGRRNAVRSLGGFFTRVPLTASAITPQAYAAAVATLLAALNDYAVDTRGDVGSFVRLAVLQVLPTVLLFGCQDERPLLAPDTAKRALQGVVKAAMEKLDRVRRAAGLALCTLLVQNGEVFMARACGSREAEGADDVAKRSRADQTALIALRQFLSSPQAKTIEWASPAQVFPSLAPLLLTAPCADTFGLAAMEGLVVSAGDVSGHVRDPAVQALLAIARSADAAEAEATQVRLSSYMVTIANKYVHCERVLVPLSRTVDVCLNQGIFHDRWHADMVDVLRHELKYYALNITVLLPLVAVLTSLCRSTNVAARTSAWALTLTMIASRYPKVRQKVGTDFYTSLLVLSSASSTTTPEEEESEVGGQRGPTVEEYQDAMARLLETQWDGTDAAIIRTARDALYGVLHIVPPSAAAAKATANDNNEMSGQAKKGPRGAVASSYMSLVRETGY